MEHAVRDLALKLPRTENVNYITHHSGMSAAYETEEVRLNLEQIQGWDKLNSKQQEALIEKHFREIHAGRYEVARNTPFTYTVEDDPQTHGTRWGVNDNVTGFVALDEDTGDDTAIHEMYHVTTGANKGLTKRTFDL